jgi:lysophospholipase L1-like esterase
VRLRLLNLAIALALLSLYAGDTAPQPLVTPPGQLSVVALGDSVTSGYHCYCRAFPALYGDLLHQRTGTGVAVRNLGAPGLDSQDLLSELDDRDSLAVRATSAADVVLLTIGANDFADHEKDVTNGRCRTECVTAELSQLATNLRRILLRIRDLQPADPPDVLVTDYWNVFQDGDVARRAFPPTGQAATTTLTLAANQVIAGAAHAAGATFVDLYDPFETDDVTALLASDGDHPNPAGHTLIAHILLAATPNHLGASSHQGG